MIEILDVVLRITSLAEGYETREEFLADMKCVKEQLKAQMLDLV